MATDKWTQKLLTWLETQPAETQTRIKGMLEKGLIKEIKAELPAGWASAAPSTKSKAATPETKPAEPKPKKEIKPKTEAKPKAETKAATPEAKPTAEPAKTKTPVEQTPKAKTSASKNAQPEQPKKAKTPRGTKNALGYETFPEKAQAELRAGGSNRERLGKALKKFGGKINPVGPYVAGETLRKGLGSAKNIKAGAVGTAISAATAAPDVYDAVVTKKGQDPEANRRAKRQVAQTVGAGIGTWAGGALGGMATTPTVAGVPVGVAVGATGGGIAGEKIAGAIYDRFDPPPVVEKLETKPQSAAPVEQGRDWEEGELDKLFDADRQTEQLKQRQQDAVDQVPNPILEEERRAAQAADLSSSSMGPSSKPPGMYNEPPDAIRDMLTPEIPDENFNRLLQMQEYARSNPAANLRKKRIMQAGLDAVETGTFRARRPDRYAVVV